MSRDILGLDLSPRPNVNVERSNAKYVLNVIGYGLLALVGYIILVLVMV